MVTSVYLPFFIWTYLTRQNFYNYHNRKIIFFSLCIGNICSLFLPFFLKIEIEFLLPLILKIPVSICITESMLIHLCRFLFFMSFPARAKNRGVLPSGVRTRRFLFFIFSFFPTITIFILCFKLLQKEEIHYIPK